MEISKEKVVSLVYELRVDDAEGDVVETLDEKNPLTFVFNSGYLLPKFEENIVGLTSGDSFEFQLPPEEAYGVVNDNAIVSVPIAAFQVDGKVDDALLAVGARIPMQDNTGNKLTGTVKSIGSENVEMDFNHPMAGNKLFFKGKVTDVREASDEELNASGCGCGCGDSGCGDGGCGDGSCDDQQGAESCGCGSGGCH